MKILEEIRSQPLWLRELMFVFCVIITVSAIGGYWLNSLERNLVTLINPADRIEESEYAKNNKPIFASVLDSIGNMGASMMGFVFPSDDSSRTKSGSAKNITTKENTYLLPLSGSKDK